MQTAEHRHHHEHNGHGTPDDGHAHHEMPTSGGALTSIALSATLHCLTGCALGEIAGMVIGTALGWSEWATVGLAVGLAFLFGYTLTSIPLLRAGMALSTVIPIALAADTLSIATMEVVDNGIMLAVPGAMESGVGSLLFWASLSVALVIAGAVALPVNRWLIARGKGHVAVHETGIHGGPPVRLVAAVAAVAGVFGTTVLAVELFDGSGGHGTEAPLVRGLTASANGMTLVVDETEFAADRPAKLAFSIDDSEGSVRDFEVEHEKRMHLIVVRRDLTEFQHLHPAMAADGTWSTPITFAEAGQYRVFADFKREDRNETLASDVTVAGSATVRSLPPESPVADTGSGYVVALAGETAAGAESELGFTITRDGQPVDVEPYLGAGGHLVALREGDLAYLHVHPMEETAAAPGEVAFATEFPSKGRYRLFLQFKHAGEVHTAAFTREVRVEAPAGSGEDEDAEGH